jgi:xylulokinase
MKTLGIDIGSSSIKVAILDVVTGKRVATVTLPDTEMKIDAPQTGWAEQDPMMWWNYVSKAIPMAMQQAKLKPDQISAIGITYQMHGLVCLDKNAKPLRKSIIWCDSRAVTLGNDATLSIGREKCLSHLLNTPGNFTASKLAWVKKNEPEIYKQIGKIMLPGDFIALMLTGKSTTTVTGLSEGMMWDYLKNAPAGFLLDHFGFSHDLLSDIVPQFGFQGELLEEVAHSLGLNGGIPITYRAGDQPNNAFSLNVLNPGEVAATAGTSGVVYGVSDQVKYDGQSRVNTFVHVNHTEKEQRLGVLLCINGTGILNSWMRHEVAGDLSYEQINQLASTVAPGSDGVTILPFGNGAERMLGNQEPGCVISGVNFNTNSKAHLLRAAQEGIAFAFKYGMKAMEETGIDLKVIRAGKANLFLSPIFRETLATITGVRIELYDTDGALGAARGAAVGAGLYASFEEAFKELKVLETIEPNPKDEAQLLQAYKKWERMLSKNMEN